jgi:hypothetical protein
MKDAQIWAWIASHQLLTYVAIMAVAGSLAGLVRKRSDEEWAAFKAEHPYTAQIVEMLRGYGIDGPKIFGAALALIMRIGGFEHRPDDRATLVPPDTPTPREPPPPPPTHGGFV